MSVPATLPKRKKQLSKKIAILFALVVFLGPRLFTKIYGPLTETQKTNLCYLGIPLCLIGTFLALMQLSKRGQSVRPVSIVKPIQDSNRFDRNEKFTFDIPYIHFNYLILIAVYGIAVVGSILLFLIFVGAVAFIDLATATFENIICAVLIVPLVSLLLGATTFQVVRLVKAWRLSVSSPTPKFEINNLGIRANIFFLEGKVLDQLISQKQGEINIPWTNIETFSVEPGRSRRKRSIPAYYKVKVVGNESDLFIRRGYFEGREEEIFGVVQAYIKCPIIFNDQLL